MCFSCLWPWGGKSPASSKPKKRSRRKTKRDKKPKNFDSSRAKNRSSSDDDSNSDEGIILNERQTDDPFQGLANGFRDVRTFLSNPRVCYMLPWALVAFVGIQISKVVESPAPGGSFLGNIVAIGMAQPALAWPMTILACIHSVPEIVNWWNADSKNKTTSTVPTVQFFSPISTEEAFVIPEYLTKVESSITRLNVMDGSSGLPPALEDPFRRAMEEANLFKEINDVLMTDIELRIAGHYDQLAQIHVDIERAIIDIADRNETNTSFWNGWFTTGQPYPRARRHHNTLLSITKDMIKASDSEMKLPRDHIRKLGKFVTLEDHHGAICGLRPRTIKSVRRWTKETKDIRAEVKVMCNSSKRSKLKLDVALGALKDHLASVDAVHKGLSALQHDRAETLEAALLSYCKSLLEAMQRLAKFGNA